MVHSRWKFGTALILGLLAACGTEPDECTGDACTADDLTGMIFFSRSVPDTTATLAGARGDVYAIRPDGSGLRNVTNAGDTSWNILPSLSPDGSRLAFFSSRGTVGGTPQLEPYVLDLASGRLPKVGTHRCWGVTSAPLWAWDGTRIAYREISTRCSGVVWQLVSDTPDSAHMVRAGHTLCDIGDPRWLPNGQGILAPWGCINDASSLTRFGLDGSMTPLVREATVPSFSPDGAKLLYFARPSTEYGYSSYSGILFVADADGSDPQAITADSAVYVPAGWSPDGQWIAYLVTGSGPDSETEVWRSRPDGSEALNLSRSPANDYSPSWSPDSRRIAFTSERDGNAEIYVVNVDGSGLRNLTNHPNPDREPNWSPIR
jgi:Tol biopolymer transport system component